MHTSREGETSMDEAALVPSASKREKMLVESTSGGETMLMPASSKRESAITSYITKSTHETVLAPGTVTREREMSVNGRSVVPNMTATATVSPADANYIRRKKMCSCCRSKLCCHITIVTVIVLVALLLFLILYIFKARKPEITSQDVKVKNLSFSTQLPVSITLSLGVNIKIKNPNYAGWKYKQSTTALYYHGPEVGMATVPAGIINARSSAALNISADVDTVAMTSSRYLLGDLRSGYLPLETYTVMTGKVLIIKIIKIHATVYMNCSLNINLLTWDTARDCKTKVHL
jgi:Late embryogenesis abundant protein